MRVRVCMVNGTVHGLTTLPQKPWRVHLSFPIMSHCLSLPLSLSPVLSLFTTVITTLSSAFTIHPISISITITMPRLPAHHTLQYTHIPASLNRPFTLHPPLPVCSRTPKASHRRRQFSPAAPKDATVHSTLVILSTAPRHSSLELSRAPIKINPYPTDTIPSVQM